MTGFRFRAPCVSCFFFLFDSMATYDQSDSQISNFSANDLNRRTIVCVLNLASFFENLASRAHPSDSSLPCPPRPVYSSFVVLLV